MQRSQKPKRPVATIDKVEFAMPEANMSERSVLGIMLIDRDRAIIACEMLRADDFHDERHRNLFSLLSLLVDKGKQYDMATVGQFLMRKKKVDAVGGLGYVSSLTDGVLPQMIEQHIEEIARTSRHRQMITTLNLSLAQAIDHEANIDEVIGELQNRTIQITQANTSVQKIEEVAREVVLEIWEKKKGNLRAAGISTTVPDLDVITNGISRSEYIVLAGRTGHGKSSFARQIALKTAKSGDDVSIFSPEMTRQNIMQCLLATEARVPFDQIRNPIYMGKEEFGRVEEAAKRIRELPILIDDRGGLEIRELCARIRAAIMRGTKLAIVDYLQLISVNGTRDPYDRVTQASAYLRDLSKVTGVPILALSQLRRPDDVRDNQEPTLYELKESGNIENDAFQVWLIYRPKEKDEITGNKRWTGMDKIIVAKNRNGPLDSARVKYLGEFLTFEPRTQESMAAELKIPKEVKPATPVQAYLDRYTDGDTD